MDKINQFLKNNKLFEQAEIYVDADGCSLLTIKDNQQKTLALLSISQPDEEHTVLTMRTGDKLTPTFDDTLDNNLKRLWILVCSPIAKMVLNLEQHLNEKLK